MSDIAKNIKKLRQKKELTQEELAEKLYVTRQAVSNWETGKNQPDLDTLKNLAEALGSDVKDILYGPTPDENRRKKIIAAAAFCILAAVAWAVYVPLKKWAEYELKMRFRMEGWLLSSLAVRPLAFLLLGAAVAALISLWLNVPPMSRKVRRGMLAVGATISLLYAFLMLWYWFGLSFKWLSRPLSAWSKAPWTFLLPGALLFWGWPRKAG